MLFVLVPTWLQEPPPSVDAAQRTILPLYPLMDKVPEAGDGHTVPAPLKVPPLGVAPTVTAALAEALPLHSPVPGTVYT